MKIIKSRVIGKKQALWAAAAALWLLILAAVLILTATRAVNAQARRVPVYGVARGDRSIALTFNCAWGDETTDGVLRLLRENGVRATFFIVGTFAREYLESVKKIANAGHELGNHSMRHKDPTLLKSAEIRADIEECNALIKTLTGVSPKLYRAPSGAYDNKTIEAAESLGLTAVQWTADSIDWKNPSPEKMTERILNKTKPGAILLFHLGKRNTAQALPDIIEALKNGGYTFLTVSELLPEGETYIDRNGVMQGG